jgi:DNA-binding Lrp family transcriptional regulator
VEFARLPRFKRTQEIAPMQLTERDREIVQLMHRHRFLRSKHVIALIGESSQQVLRRLQLLFHHGYLERPRAQIDYYRRGGSRHIVYGISNKGVALLRSEHAGETRELDWSQKNRAIGRVFLEHALLISDVMVSLELACRSSDRVRLLTAREIPLPDAIKRLREPFRWRVKLSNGLRVGLVPDHVFALELADNPANRSFFFLEADRGTMPVARATLSQTSFYRKLLAYEATWSQGIHRSRFGFHRCRVLTVTSSRHRVERLVAACQRLERGRGLFLFADSASLAVSDPLSHPWQTGRPEETVPLVDTPPTCLNS